MLSFCRQLQLHKATLLMNEFFVRFKMLRKAAFDFSDEQRVSPQTQTNILWCETNISLPSSRDTHLIFPISSYPYNRDGSSPAGAFIRAPEAWGISLEVKTRLFSPSCHWWTWCHWGWTWLACLCLTTECVCQAKHWGTAVSHCPWPRCAVSLPTTGPASGNAWAGALKKVAVQKARPLSLSWLSHI